MLMLPLTVMVAACMPLAAEPPKSEPLKVAPGCPVITEVLYAVPTGETGDANRDGSRNAAGDEFVELTNPHDKPIQLRGCKITDKSLGKPGAMSFTFPECELKPGQVVVVFNGFEANIPGPVGDSAKAPSGPNDKFGGALVFSMKVNSNRVGLANAADCVALSGPDGKCVQIVKWGAMSDTMPECPLVEEAPATNKASIARRGLTKGFVVHDQLPGATAFSAGKFDAKAPPAPEKKEEPAPTEKSKSDPKKPAENKPKTPKP